MKYWYAQYLEYTTAYLDELYFQLEYYLSYSDNELVKFHLDNLHETELIYSIEDRTWEGRKYVALGISNDRGTHSTIIQWIYSDMETGQLYEYDIAADRLIEFE